MVALRAPDSKAISQTHTRALVDYIVSQVQGVVNLAVIDHMYSGAVSLTLGTETSIGGVTLCSDWGAAPGEGGDAEWGEGKGTPSLPSTLSPLQSP